MLQLKSVMANTGGGSGETYEITTKGIQFLSNITLEDIMKFKFNLPSEVKKIKKRRKFITSMVKITIEVVIAVATTVTAIRMLR